MSNDDNLLQDPEILRQLIMDHYQYPHNHELTEDSSYRRIHMASDSCIDDITVQSKIEGDTIADIRFAGEACAISTASTSMMTELLRGKSREEAARIIDNYFAMIDNRTYDPEVLEEAVAFQNVYRQPNRINCATIGWKAIRQMLEESEKEEK